jgi:membrane protease YdiL (CAAX protease family)
MLFLRQGGKLINTIEEVKLKNNREEKNHVAIERRRFIEVLIIMAMMLVSVFLVPELKGLLSIVPIVYYFVERRIREGNSTSSDSMISRASMDIHLTWKWILLVAVVSQVVFILIFKYISPDTLAHILERLPSSGELDGKLALAILIAPLGEEITYRGLFQERFGWFMPTWLAIGVTSLFFAFMHLSSGPVDVVFWDLFSVFVDSLLFGVIYAKTKNILVSYIAHLFADIIGLLLLVVTN